MTASELPELRVAAVAAAKGVSLRRGSFVSVGTGENTIGFAGEGATLPRVVNGEDLCAGPGKGEWKDDGAGDSALDPDESVSRGSLPAPVAKNCETRPADNGIA